VNVRQLEIISTDPMVMHGQAVIAGTRVPISVILDCLAAGVTAEEITTEYPTITVSGVRSRGLRSRAGTRRSASAVAAAVTFDLHEFLLRHVLRLTWRVHQ
jgi:uncharacterized protein (DUF433 family)